MKNLLLNLPRPEYPSNPEILLASLGWELLGRESSLGMDKNLGQVYKSVKAGGRFRVNSIVPPDRDENWNGVVHKAHKAGLDKTGDDLNIVSSLLNSMIGTKPGGASAYSCIPINTEMVYFQDLRGIYKKQNPPRLGKIFNSLFSFGTINVHKNNQSAAHIWFESLNAVEKSSSFDNFLEKYSSSLRPPMNGGTSGIKDTLDYVKPPVWFPKEGTPFHWFGSAWLSLCTNNWIQYMPPRRWVDWSSCVLRTALGICYLWESRYYRNLGYSLISGKLDADGILGKNSDLFNWSDNRTKPSIRNENGNLNLLIADGQKVRKCLESFVGEYPDTPDVEDLNEIVNWLHEHIKPEHKERLQKCFNHGIDGDSRLTHETVVYSLLNRNEWGEYADLYGVLKRVKRIFRVFEPSPEWLTVIASLSTDPITNRTTYSSLKDEINSLGIGFSKSVLIAELERLGLSKVLNDADDAIEIKAAFMESL
jgi:hypothetical protein